MSTMLGISIQCEGEKLRKEGNSDFIIKFQVAVRNFVDFLEQLLLSLCVVWLDKNELEQQYLAVVVLVSF